MAATYKIPGVYVEEIPKFPPSVAPVDTAIPAFIGYTQKGEVNTPTRIESLVDFETAFGTGQRQPDDAVTVSIVEVTADETTKREASLDIVVTDTGKRSAHILHSALQLFYANGGRSAYIVSAGTITDSSTPKEDELKKALVAVATVDEPTLLVVPEATALSNSDYKSLLEAALAQCQELGDRFVIADAHDANNSFAAPATNAITAMGNFRNEATSMANLKYGAAYAPHLETILDPVVDESQLVVSYTRDGTAQKVDNGKLVDGDGQAGQEIRLADLAEAANAAYEQVRTKILDIPLVLPPSAAIAGVYAQVDADRGVWKAPANVSLAAVVRPVITFTQAALENLNVDPTAGKSINAIRSFTGKGTLVWGARTLAGNDNEWRYVNVRRFFIFAEESIRKATEQFVFEPNDANTWVKVQAMVENFLTTQWRAGALQGVKPEHAFYVAVGLGRTMTALDILEGRMIVEIGMAVVRPAEFIILRFSHKMAES